MNDAEREAIDRHGWFVFRSVLAPDRLERLRSAFEEAAGSTAAAPRAGGRAETGTRHAADLLERSGLFAEVAEHPILLAVAAHILGRPFRLFQLAGRDPLPGFGQQGLHNDWLPRGPSDPFSLVTAVVLLDAFTASNGATRVVPGSHRQPRQLPKSMQDPGGHHPREIVITAPAGSLLVFNGHLWHSGTRNASSGSRRVLQCQYVARAAAAGPFAAG